MVSQAFPVFSEQQPIGLILDKQMHERALLNRPNSPKLLEKLADLCIELEDMQGANAYIEKIQNHIEYSPTWMLHVAKLHYRVHRYQRALETLQELPELEACNPASLYLQAKIKFQLNQFESASELINKILAVDPAHQGSKVLLMKMAASCGQVQQTRSLYSEILRDNPTNVEAQAIKLDNEFNSRYVNQEEFLTNYLSLIKTSCLAENVIKRSRIPVFNKQLNEAIGQRPDWVTDPVRFATNNGRQLLGISDIGFGRNKIIKQLQALIRLQLIAYLNRMRNLQLPYFRTSFTSWSINLWAVQLNAGGFQTPHIHPDGWLSGVYYSQTPNSSKDTDQGTLEFGINDSNNAFQPLVQILPRNGMLVIFPAYYRHRTRPFSSEKLRISLSFDISID